MGASYVYKKLSPQDKAIIPFNAHKQYSFNSSSAENNSVDYYSSSYTSESISLYSSSSSGYGGDIINNTKYNQIDHLFYRNYIKDPSKKKDIINHLKQRRELYEKANILSIPSGLYGAEIRPSSFYLSSSQYEVLDDSYGNLIISGTFTENYPNIIEQNVFRLDPIKGFKKYDLAVYDGYAVFRQYYDTQGGQVSPANPTRPNPSHIQVVERKYWRQGMEIPGGPSTYTTNKVNWNVPLGEDIDQDDSYFFNNLHYNNIIFHTSSLESTSLNKFSSLKFNSATSSYIQSPHKDRLNFNKGEDFSISFYIKPNPPNNSTTEKRYILSKSTTKTIPTPGSGSLSMDVDAGNQYPFEIYMISQSLYFERSDGNTTNTISRIITSSDASVTSSYAHILCQMSSSVMQLYFNGDLENTELTSTIKDQTRNKANLYIGSKGHLTTADGISTSDNKYYNGEISNINIWSRAYDTNTITNISESINASPYIGNIFYKTGLATITHPKYHSILLNGGDNNKLDKVQFQGSHLMWEHEYQCTIQEHEYNYTLNTSIRDNTGPNPYKLEGFVSSSFFKPYITTIGLYNENYELLAIGKLAQPIRCSDETDTTFVVRFDT